MDKVSFTAMKGCKKEDFDLVIKAHNVRLGGLADRVLRELGLQNDEEMTGYQISHLGHALQTATRAHREGADIDWVVAALTHDIGDGLAPQNHDRFAAEMIRPFMREEVVWTVEHHSSFQMYYYAGHYGWNQFEREKYQDSIYYQSCIDFCERWDQASFDPDYATETLEFFTPMVREVFARKAYMPEIIQKGVVRGLPRLPQAAE